MTSTQAKVRILEQISIKTSELLLAVSAARAADIGDEDIVAAARIGREVAAQTLEDARAVEEAERLLGAVS